MSLTARYVGNLEEVRLYKDNGHYWPVKFKGDAECAKGFVKFVNGEPVELIDCDCLSSGEHDSTCGCAMCERKADPHGKGKHD